MASLYLAHFLVLFSCCTCPLVDRTDANTDTRHTRLRVRTKFGSEDEKVLFDVLEAPCVTRWLHLPRFVMIPTHQPSKAFVGKRVARLLTVHFGRGFLFSKGEASPNYIFGGDTLESLGGPSVLFRSCCCCSCAAICACSQSGVSRPRNSTHTLHRG